MTGQVLLFVILVATSLCTTNVSQVQIPLSVWRNLATVKDNREFMRRYFLPADIRALKNMQIGTILHSPDIKLPEMPDEITGPEPMYAAPDTCSPRETAVEVPMPSDPALLYWPHCVRLFRCGGCCQARGDELMCRPTQNKTTHVSLMKVRYILGDRFKFEGRAQLPMVEHVNCQCQCRVRREDCASNSRVYDPYSCKCKCPSGVSRQCPNNKRWNETSCSCQCEKNSCCHDQEFFNTDTCRCEVIPGSESVRNTTPRTPARRICPRRCRRLRRYARRRCRCLPGW